MGEDVASEADGNLWDAIFDGDLDSIQHAINAGCNIEFRPGLRSPLGLAVELGKPDVAALLLDHGASPFNVFIEGSAPFGAGWSWNLLDCASKWNNTEFLELIEDRIPQLGLSIYSLTPLDVDAEKATYFIRKNPSIKKIDLSSASPNNESIVLAILKDIASNPNIDAISFFNANLTPLMCIGLIEMLKINSNVKQVVLTSKSELNLLMAVSCLIELNCMEDDKNIVLRSVKQLIRNGIFSDNFKEYPNEDPRTLVNKLLKCLINIANDYPSLVTFSKGQTHCLLYWVLRFVFPKDIVSLILNQKGWILDSSGKFTNVPFLLVRNNNSNNNTK